MGTSAGFISLLELGKRRPSYRRLARLARVLEVDQRALFWLANPGARRIVERPSSQDTLSAWERFNADYTFVVLTASSTTKMEVLFRVTTIGEVRSPHEFIYILNAVRYAVGR